jgi:hypothetical protein
MRKNFVVFSFLVVMVLFSSTILEAELRDYRSEFSFRNVFGRNAQTLEGQTRPINMLRTGEPNLLEVLFQYNDWGTWLDEEKFIFDYDAQDRLIESLYYWWDEYEQQWLEETRITCQWDGDNLIEIMMEIYYEDSWEDFILIEQQFNAQNQIILAEAWMNIEGEWIDFALFEYDYDAQNRIETMTQTFYLEPPTTTRETEFDRVIFAYDSNDRIEEIIDQYSLDGEVWENYGKSEIDYHPNDNSEYSVFQDLINNNILYMMTWGLQWQEPMFEAEIYYEWDGNDWEYIYLDEYEYHSNDKLEYIYFYDYYYGSWELMDRDYYLYDEDWILSEILFQWYDGEEWVDWGRMLTTHEEVSADDLTIPTAELNLSNYPNPFNPETTIAFDLPESGNVRLDIYNIRGQKVTTLINKELSAGNHQFIWNGKNQQGNTIPSGIYLYRVDADGGRYTSTRKMLLLK